MNSVTKFPQTVTLLLIFVHCCVISRTEADGNAQDSFSQGKKEAVGQRDAQESLTGNTHQENLKQQAAQLKQLQKQFETQSPENKDKQQHAPSDLPQGQPLVQKTEPQLREDLPSQKQPPPQQLPKDPSNTPLGKKEEEKMEGQKRHIVIPEVDENREDFKDRKKDAVKPNDRQGAASGDSHQQHLQPPPEEPKQVQAPLEPQKGNGENRHTNVPHSQPETQRNEEEMTQTPAEAQVLHQPPQAHVTPPILVDSVDEFPEDEEFPEEEEEVVEPTPEEIEAEKLFQAGEKLINATYYKEYKEAYLNFLQASELGHQKAQEYVAFGHLFGDYLPQNVTRTAELFQELASKGSPKAQMGLAFMYSAGFQYNSSQAKALIYSTFGALGGDPMAQMALGYRYYAGIGVESKCETALTYYRKVATKVADSVTLAGGPVVQRIRLQEEAESQGSNNSPLLDDDLLQYYHFLADKGDQQAQVVLGTLYYQGGKGVQINHEQAYHYFSTAAESGSGHALGYLGKMHSEGSPVVTQSNQTAFEYFKKSADKNNHIGQAGLGMIYLNGLGVEKDTNKAFRWFSLASDQGSVDGQLQLGIMYFSGNGVRKDYKMAVKYFTMASQNGHVLAFFNLAQMHATGIGVLRNCHTSVELFKNVAERGRWSEMMMEAHRMYHAGQVDAALVKYMFLAELGYEVAQSNVAYMLDNGVTSKFDGYETHQRALLQYSRAASQGSTHARLKMGDYHYYGLGTDIDYESAASHYRLASEQQHNPQAMFNLGYMHEKGLGLKQDVHLAKRFYDMAAETSLDAHVPVTMALFKLGLFYGMDVFSKEFEGVSGILGMMDPVAYFGPDWDLYLASFFASVFAVLFFLRVRRMR